MYKLVDLKLPCLLCKQTAETYAEMAFTPDGGFNGYMVSRYCRKCEIEITVRAETEEACVEKAQAVFNNKSSKE